MRPRDLFGVAVRIVGFWFVTEAFYWGFWALIKSFAPNAGNPHVSVQEDLASTILYIFLALFTLSGAHVWIWLAYGDAPKQISPSKDDEAAG
jgi:hypothetical protein